MLMGGAARSNLHTSQKIANTRGASLQLKKGHFKA